MIINDHHVIHDDSEEGTLQTFLHTQKQGDVILDIELKSLHCFTTSLHTSAVVNKTNAGFPNASTKCNNGKVSSVWRHHFFIQYEIV